jgi:flagella basal body P-ring formation protein FlgA
MRRLFLILCSLFLAAHAAKAKDVKKKMKSGKYNAAEYIKAKETQQRVVTNKDKVQVDATKIAGMTIDCDQVKASPTAPLPPTEAVEKAVEEKPADQAKVNSTQQALDMAKTVVKTVKENCRPEKPASIEPAVGVQVVNPGALGEQEAKGERPELSGTVGVNATF